MIQSVGVEAAIGLGHSRFFFVSAICSGSETPGNAMVLYARVADGQAYGHSQRHRTTNKNNAGGVA
jgi:hypothetical protein